MTVLAGVLAVVILQAGAVGSLEDRARTALMSELKDPMSAQFTNLREVPLGEDMILCGEVNAKNSYGGYGGFRSFMSSKTATIMVKVDDPVLGPATQRVIDSLCRVP